MIDLDILLLWPLSIFWSRTVLRWLALVLLVIDFVSRICLSYYFSPADLLLAIPSAPLLHWRDFTGIITLSLMLVAVFFFLFGAIYPGRTKRRLPLVAGVCLLFFVLFAEKRLAGFGSLRTSDVSQRGLWDLSTSGVHAVYFLTVNAPDLSSAGIPHPFHRIHSASAPFFVTPPLAVRGIRPVSLSARPDLLLITVESLGLPKDAALEQALRSLFETEGIRDRFMLKTGTVPFFGATVSGQLRELCQSTIGLHILVNSNIDPSTCLPMLLRKQGYETEGIHNGSGRIFNRDEWYPRLGFEHSWFREQLSQEAHLPNCEGPFMGTCDASIAEWIGNRLASERHAPRFIHWMTLDSHLPIFASTENLHAADCTLYSITASATDVCAWFGSETRTLKSIATLLSRRDLPPVDVIVVGDHAPPFLIESERLQFSQVDVPYMHFIPRDSRSNSTESALSSASLADAKPLSGHSSKSARRPTVR